MNEGFKTFFLYSLNDPIGFKLGESKIGIDELGLTSLNQMQLHPTFGYSERIESRHELYTAETGQVRQSRLIGGKFRFSLPFNLMNSSDANQIRRYWQNADDVRFTTVFSDDSSEFVDCRIINVNDPFNSYTKFQNNDFDGILTLLSINDQNTAREIQKEIGIPGLGPFILDDAIQGILDNPTYRIG